MQSYYRINVSKDGKYLFATEQGGLIYTEDARRVFKIFKEVFPEKDGYKVTVQFCASFSTKQKW